MQKLFGKFAKLLQVEAAKKNPEAPWVAAVNKMFLPEGEFQPKQAKQALIGQLGF